MFSHVILGTNDIEKAEKFYDAVMGVLGHPVLFRGGGVAAYGAYVRDPDGNKIQAVCHRKQA